MGSGAYTRSTGRYDAGCSTGVANASRSTPRCPVNIFLRLEALHPMELMCLATRLSRTGVARLSSEDEDDFFIPPSDATESTTESDFLPRIEPSSGRPASII